jgi:hypothetical protein
MLATRHGYIVMTANEETLPLAVATLLTDLRAPMLRKPFDIGHLLDDVVLEALRHPARRLKPNL